MTPAALPYQGTLNILMVEDDDGDAMTLERAFDETNIPHHIVRAVNGREALDMLKGINGKAKPPLPQILLVDLNMPKMNGIQLVQALRADPELRRTIVFILTTSGSDEDRMAAYALNVAGYIAKAANDEDDFVNLVGLIEYYFRCVELP